MAGATREWLLAKDVLVTGINNDVTSGRLQTEIRVYGRYAATAAYLATLMGLPQERVRRSADGVLAEGVLVALGLGCAGDRRELSAAARLDSPQRRQRAQRNARHVRRESSLGC